MWRSGAVVGIALVVAGCATVATDTRSLEAQGYRRVRLTYVTSSGDRREVTNYELWTRELYAPVRRFGACLIPKVASGGYNWLITVSVDNKEAWSYQSGQLYGKPSLKIGTDCTESAPLPEGRLSYGVNFTYWH